VLIEQPYTPNLDEQTYSIQETATLVKYLQEEGTEVQEVLEGTGIKEALLYDPAALVSIRQRLVVYHNVLRLSEDPALGLHVGKRSSVSDYGIWGYAILSCNSLRGAIDFGFKYMKLAGPLGKKSFEVEGGKAIFLWEDVLGLEKDIVPFVVELWYGSSLQWIYDVMRSDFQLQEMRFSYPAPRYVKVYEETFGCPVHFNCEDNAMIFDASYLDQPTARANPLTEQMCRELCDRMLLDLQAKTGIVKDVHSIILNTPGHIPDITKVAEKLCMTSRTLRRKLDAHGTSYLQLLTEIRKQLAISYLRDTDMSIEEISDLVGFSDSSNFRTAFKRWTDKTPSMYRNQL